MKTYRHIILVLFTLFLLIFTACSSKSSDKSPTTKPSNTCVHTWVDATCTKAKTCSKCSKQEGNVLNHDYIDSYVKESKCTEDGEKTLACTRCNNTIKKEIPATGHNFIESITKKASCTEVGLKTFACSNCNEAKTESISAVGHHYSSTITKAPTCTEKGIKTYKCDNCENLKSEAITETGHNWKSATCIEPKKCTICNASNQFALGHTTDNGTCTRCGQKIEKIYKIGDTWIIKDQWEFRIDSVKTHEMCNRFSDHNHLPQCIIITYTYKNLGYEGFLQNLYISSMSFDVYDEIGESAETYPCTHTKSPKVLDIGTQCTGAQVSYALYNVSNKVRFTVELYSSNNTGKHKAVFDLTITN